MGLQAEQLLVTTQQQPLIKVVINLRKNCIKLEKSQSLKYVASAFHARLEPTFDTQSCAPGGVRAPKHFCSESAKLVSDNPPAGGKVYESVPDALKRQHATTGDAKLEAYTAPMCEAIKTIDGARDPGDQDGKGEDEACPEISHLNGIKASQLERGI